ncbi:hypothetical protein HK100_007524 [Physocladia obscura]|uniref:Uncharacterized protein n=1 Tax=Physocladia obscura TaxID=109957 RepID=A0AAD5XAR6_9FUNG|nr:hypothetical protein HK100_007524 [Physocladia obscura]
MASTRLTVIVAALVLALAGSLTYNAAMFLSTSKNAKSSAASSLINISIEFPTNGSVYQTNHRLPVRINLELPWLDLIPKLHFRTRLGLRIMNAKNGPYAPNYNMDPNINWFLPSYTVKKNETAFKLKIRPKDGNEGKDPCFASDVVSDEHFLAAFDRALVEDVGPPLPYKPPRIYSANILEESLNWRGKFGGLKLRRFHVDPLTNVASRWELADLCHQ